MFRGKHRCFPSDEATDPCVYQPQAQQQGLTSAARRAQKGAAGLNRTFHPPVLLWAKQSGSVKKGSCPHKTCVRQLLPCTGVANYLWSFGGCFSLWAIPVAGRTRPLSGAGGKAADVEVCSCFCRLGSWYTQAAGTRLLLECSLLRLLEDVSCFTSNWWSQWLVKDRELSTVDIPEKLLVYWTL